MNDKIRGLKDLQYYGDIELLMALIQEANKKQDTPKLKSMTEAISRVYLYVHNLLEERKMFNRAISEYREDKLRAIERAKRAEKKVEELTEKLKKVNIFGE